MNLHTSYGLCRTKGTGHVHNHSLRSVGRGQFYFIAAKQKNFPAVAMNVAGEARRESIARCSPPQP